VPGAALVDEDDVTVGVDGRLGHGEAGCVEQARSARPAGQPDHRVGCGLRVGGLEPGDRDLDLAPVGLVPVLRHGQIAAAELGPSGATLGRLGAGHAAGVNTGLADGLAQVVLAGTPRGCPELRDHRQAGHRAEPSTAEPRGTDTSEHRACLIGYFIAFTALGP